MSFFFFFQNLYNFIASRITSLFYFKYLIDLCNCICNSSPLEFFYFNFSLSSFLATGRVNSNFNEDCTTLSSIFFDVELRRGASQQLAFPSHCSLWLTRLTMHTHQFLLIYNKIHLGLVLLAISSAYSRLIAICGHGKGYFYRGLELPSSYQMNYSS